MLPVFLTAFPFAGAIIVYIAGRRNKNVRNLAACAVAAIEFLAALGAVPVLFGTGIVPGLELPYAAGLGISFSMDGFQGVYGILTAFMWLVSTVFSTQYMEHHRNRNRYYLFQLFTLGATMGVFLSADFFTTFLFFEIMSLTSYVWVAQEEKREAMKAAETYLAVAVIGGMVLLMGLFLLYDLTGTLKLGELKEACRQIWEQGDTGRLWAAGLCMLFGFGAKAGAVPMHIWLPKAHPVAPAPASALLSGVLTKTGIFGILVLCFRVFYGIGEWGTVITATGAVTMVTGAVLALFSIDLKRTLACSSVSQIGFILTGAGMAVLLESAGSAEAVLGVRGLLLHMVNHSLFKLLLFSIAGVIYMNVHKLDLNAIRGYGRKKPLLKAMFLMGALGIAGVPLWSGYISKTLIHESIIVYEAMNPAFWVTVLEWLFLLSGGFTAAYMAKLYRAVFVEENRDARVQQMYDREKKYMNKATAAVLAAVAALLPLLGVFASVFMDRLADVMQGFCGSFPAEESIRYMSWENLAGAFISLAVGAIVYILMVRKWMVRDGEYVDRWNPRLDLENSLYRPLLAGLEIFGSTVLRLCDRLLDYIIVFLRRTVYRDAPIPHELEEGSVATHVLGVLLDDGKEALNHTVYKKHPVKISFEHKLAIFRLKLRENNTLIARSLSFGLLLFCIGLVATLVYLIWG